MRTAIKYFTIGLLAALFFSPKSGEENRAEFSKMLKGYAGTLMGKQAEITHDLGSRLGEQVPALGKVVNTAADKLDDAASTLQ